MKTGVLPKGHLHDVNQEEEPAPREIELAPVKDAVWIPEDLVDPNPFQPRTEFDLAELESLATTMRGKHGQLQNVVVRKVWSDHERRHRYQLAAGERRVRALRMAGKTQVLARIFELTDEQMREIALIENAERAGIGRMKECETLESLMEDLGKRNLPTTQAELCRQYSFDPNYVRSTLGLRTLPDFMQDAVKRHPDIKTSLLLINRIPPNTVEAVELRADLVEKAEKGLGYRGVEKIVNPILEEAGLRKARRIEAQTPDASTREAITLHHNGIPTSHGVPVLGVDEREARQEMETALSMFENALRHYRSWNDELPHEAREAYYNRVVALMEDKLPRPYKVAEAR